MPNVQTILAELYAIDPGLRDHEAALRPLLVQLAASRPDVTVDARFAKELRARLVETPVRVPVFQRVRNAMRMPVFATGAVALAALALLVSRNLATPSVPAVTVARDASEAFGSLANVSGGGGLGAGAPSGMGGGGVAAMSSIAPTPDAKMLIWNPVRYVYAYKGDTFDVKEETLPVYKRETRPLSADALVSSLIPSIRGLFDLGSLKGLKLQNFSLVQDTTYGYQVYVDLLGGTVSLNANYTQWPRPDAACKDDACFAQYRLKIGDVPEDGAIIATANAFLKEHGVSLADYGAPRVQNDWRTAYDASTDKDQYYIPESQQVVYPILIAGSPVFDEMGNAVGLTVGVNVRANRVDNLWGLSANAYRASDYAVERDVSRLISVAEKGGVWGGYADPNAKVVTVDLGTPTVVLMRTWLPSGDGSSAEVNVPALQFPVLQKPADQPWFSNYVTVPLAKEILDQKQDGPVIMPMVK